MSACNLLLVLTLSVDSFKFKKLLVSLTACVLRSLNIIHVHRFTYVISVMYTTTDILCGTVGYSTVTKILCQARGTLAGVDHKFVVACDPLLVVDCMNRLYLVNSFVVSLNLSSSVHVYGNMTVLGVNVCQLITNLCYVLNFILCLLSYQLAVRNGTYRLHLCFRCSIADHVFHGCYVENQQCQIRGPV
jgi:hypothetical protein